MSGSGPRIIIRSEDDAWRVLRLLEEAGDDVSIGGLEFDGWPSLHIYVETDTAETRAATQRSVEAFQDALYKSYALLAYGSSDYSKIDPQHLECFKLDVTTKEVSSRETEATPVGATKWDALIQGIRHMSTNQITFLFVIALVIGFGSGPLEKYIEQAGETDRERIRTTTQRYVARASIPLDGIPRTGSVPFKRELSKIEQIKAYCVKYPVLYEIRDCFTRAHNALLANAPPSGKFAFQGIESENVGSKNLAAPVMQSARNYFRVLAIRDTGDGVLRVQLLNEMKTIDFGQNDTFSAQLIANDDTKHLQDIVLEAYGTKKPVVLSVRHRRDGVTGKGAVIEAEIIANGGPPPLPEILKPEGPPATAAG